jgi:hypothetical protein
MDDDARFRRPRTPGPATPVKRGRDRHSVQSPYFSPSKERPPRTTKTDQTDRSLDNYASESDDPFEATQTSPTNVSGLYRQLALCKPYLIQGVLFLSLIICELIHFKNASLTIHGRSL